MTRSLVYAAMITAGGAGTRLLPFSKEVPKEMFPLPTMGPYEGPHMKPIVQAIFEQLYDVGVRDFFFVVGRGKRVIEDHFSPDQGFLEYLKSDGKDSAGLLEFYEKVGSSSAVFLNQSTPLGFGDAVLRGRHVIDGTFIVHAGDTVVISDHNRHLVNLTKIHERHRASATLLVQEVDDPRIYGVAEGKDLGDGVLQVSRVVEKPERPKSRLAILPVYIFEPEIFDALSTIRPGRGGEIQLTDGIQKLVNGGHRVLAVTLHEGETSLDFGSPAAIVEAFRLSGRFLQEKIGRVSGESLRMPRPSHPTRRDFITMARRMGVLLEETPEAGSD